MHLFLYNDGEEQWWHQVAFLGVQQSCFQFNKGILALFWRKGIASEGLWAPSQIPVLEIWLNKTKQACILYTGKLQHNTKERQ